MNLIRKAVALLSVSALVALNMPSSSAQSSGALVITAPSTGTVVNPGQSVSVAVTADSAVYPNGLTMAIVGQQPFKATPLQSGSSVTFAISVPSAIEPGPFNLTALGQDSSGNNVESAPITLDVERTDDPTSLAVHPGSITVYYVGATVPFSIIGSFPDVAWLDMTRSSLTTISSDNTNVAVLRNRMVVATGAGHTYVRVGYDYGSIQQNLVVVVAPSGVRGDLDGDRQVDQADVNIVQTAIGSPATTPNDARDLNHDGMITAADVATLRTLCTRPNCATH